MKRNPATSVESQIQAMANATKPPLEPPAHVDFRECDRPFWAGIISARARDEWTDADLVLAVQLARCQADIEKAQETERAEGMTMQNQRGTLVMHPIVSAHEMLVRREVRLMTTLRMGGRVLGPPDANGMRRRVERDAQTAAREVEDEELLA